MAPELNDLRFNVLFQGFQGVESAFRSLDNPSFSGCLRKLQEMKSEIKDDYAKK